MKSLDVLYSVVRHFLNIVGVENSAIMQTLGSFILFTLLLLFYGTVDAGTQKRMCVLSRDS